MSITKETIRFNPNLYGFSGDTLTGNSMNIKISFGSHDNFTGLQQEIDRQTSITTADLINPVTDEEKRRFGKADAPITQVFQFRFYNGATHTPSYTAAGFTTEELSATTLNVQNSFWIFDYYDSFDPNKQVKLFSTYLTTIGTTPSFSVANEDSQLYYQYVPKSYTDTLTGLTVTGYMKISFFNAKTGKVQLFLNERNISKDTGEVICFPVELNLYYRTWTYLITGTGTQVKGKELDNSVYTDRVNATVEDFDNQKQVYPIGNTYNYQDNDYLTT